MTRLSMTFLSLVLSFSVFAQKKTVEHRDIIKELEKLLTYNYYNPVQDEWYINSFYFDEQSQRVHFKTISTKNPGLVTGKTYHERVFLFSDLNPYHIMIDDIKEDHGMLVKGKSLELETVKHNKSIAKVINGRKGLSQTFLLIPIPKYRMDSTPNFADDLAEKFRTIIQSETDLKNEKDPSKNKAVIFETLIGEHSFGDAKRFTEKRSDYELEYEEYRDRKRVKHGVIGYEPKEDQYYEAILHDDGSISKYFYEIDATVEKLLLVGKNEREGVNIEFINKSLFQIIDKGSITEYRPSRSF